jgi:hypothetical protein
MARDKAKEKDAETRETAKPWARLLGRDPAEIEEAWKQPNPERDKLNKRVEAMVRTERRRLIAAAIPA